MFTAIQTGIVGGILEFLFVYLLFGKICTIEQLFKMRPLLRILIANLMLVLTAVPLGYLGRYFMGLPGMEDGSANYYIFFWLMLLFLVGSFVRFIFIPLFKLRNPRLHF